MSETTPRRASDAPDIVPVAWGAGKGMSGFMWITDLSAQADSWRKDGREVEPLIRLSDHTDALAALRAELTDMKAENRELMMQDDPAFTHAFKRRAEAAEAEVARLKDREKELVAGLEGACEQILDSYRTWVADDSKAHPRPGQIPRYDRARSLTASKGG